MSSNKIGLVLSHTFVRDKEDHKFSWISKALKKYKELDLNFFTVLCGHGITPPSEISKNFDEVLWESDIMENQLGTGHPYFSTKGFEICKKASCKMTLKNRAYDYITCDTFFDKDLVISEQTSLSKKIIGDLFLYGETEYLLDWWNKNPWDYSTNGLTNLYRNMPEDFLQKATFMNPKQLGWKTFEDESNCYWGEHKNYEWYGGDGIK